MDDQPKPDHDQTAPTPAPSEPLPPHPAFATVVNVKKSRTFLWVLLVIVLLAASMYGTYYWQHQKLTTAESQVTSADSAITSLNSQLATLEKSQGSTSATASYTAAQAVSFVQTAYQTYVTTLNKGSKSPVITTTETQAANTAIKADLTPQLLTSIEAAKTSTNPVLCSQDIPTSLTAASTPDTFSDNTQSVVGVTEKISGGTINGPFVTVDLQTLKITSILCASL